MNERYCQYCLPSLRASHFDLKADYYFGKLRQVLGKPFQFALPQKWKNPDLVWIAVLHFLKMLGAVKFVSSPDPEQILNRALILFPEARKRGIEVQAIKIFGRYKNEFRYRPKDSKAYYYFETNPLSNVWASDRLDQKIEVKEKLLSYGLPVPEGQMFTNPRKALAYGLSLGFPLAVKPNSASLGNHATYPVNNEREFIRAIGIARDYRPDFIVERYLSGGNYRATVIGKEHVLISQKEIPNVTGDGRSTVRELIDQKNQDPRRGDHDKKNQSLFWILITDELKQSLFGRGLTLDSVPQLEEKVHLYDRYLPGSGFDIIDHTDTLHKVAKEIFIKAAAALNADIVGFDFICANPRLSPDSQVFGIIEANSVPYIDMHAFPSIGKSRDVAKMVWDVVSDKFKM